MSETTIAQKFLDLLEVQRDDDGHAWVSFTMQALKWTKPEYHALSNVIHGVDVDEETAYDEVYNALNRIVALGGTDYIEDEMCEISADVYTAHLTDWLGRNLSNYAWCDEAMQEFGGDFAVSIIDIIMAGQVMAKRAVWSTVISLVRKWARDENDDL